MSVTLQNNPPPFDAALMRTPPAGRGPVPNAGNTAPVAVAKDAAPPPSIAVDPLQGKQMPEPPQEELDSALAQLRQAIELRAPNELQFSVDKETGKTVIRIVDSKTGDVLRQIPPRELIEIAKSIDRMQGLLVRQQA